MKNKRIKKALKLYGLIGTAVCACAGGIVGFIVGGPLVALLGGLIGAAIGHLLENSTLKALSQ